PQLTYFLDHDFRVVKRSEVLGMLTENLLALCVAGTHGKTTTSTILAHLLHQSDIDCNAFLGG
ncbi:MAG TPA: UDP-N-acetylmuramate--L-alanine ligase, partial [Bacteroidales bacterium]|nr:UDP-N-acetylmuramate--L-alanine ligase [Bacteroidales bacterium]